METLSFLAAPIALAVLLVAIHSYLGLHVLERGVIFVDISLAQVAALGGTLSLYLTPEEGGPAHLLCSLFLCLFVAFLLALLRHYERKISQEVLIGITYALASGALILVADRLPHGTEHLKEALVGNILFVTWPKVLETLAVYSVVGAIHYLFRKQFWACSRGELTSLVWDFLFYLLFGIVITFSTAHAGVLVVFSILVVPAALACRLVQGLRAQLLLAWAIGVSEILVAFLLSYRLDLPAGASVVVTLTASFFLALLVKILYESKARSLP
ncbi:MAG: metal ABC transporter permease [Bacteriovoracia bacterium]